MLFLRRIVALAAAFVLSSAAQAIPIVYEFSGTVSSGSLNGVSFADRGFTVNVFGDTSGVTNASGLFMNAASAVTFSIAGVGGGSLTQNYRMFLDPTLAVGLQLAGGDDRMDLFANAATFGAYTLASAFGPITAGPASLFIGQFLPDPTTAGPLDMAAGPSSSVTFRSFLLATPVPEPSSWLLIALGFLGAMGSRLIGRRATFVRTVKVSGVQHAIRIAARK